MDPPPGFSGVAWGHRSGEPLYLCHVTGFEGVYWAAPFDQGPESLGAVTCQLVDPADFPGVTLGMTRVLKSLFQFLDA